MRTPASIAGHPIHPMIVPLAIGGFILSFIFDVVSIMSGARDPWATVAFHTMVGGILAALVAAVFGLADLVSLPPGHTRRVGLMHMAINLVVVALFAVSAWMRFADAESLALPRWLSLAGVGLLTVSGWLGGKLVFEAGVGVRGVGEAGEAPHRGSGRHAPG